MWYHMSAFALGFLIDLVLGDPYWLPHPIRAIGNLISGLEKRLLNPLLEGKSGKGRKDCLVKDGENHIDGTGKHSENQTAVESELSGTKAGLEKLPAERDAEKEKFRGILLVPAVLCATGLTAATVLLTAYHIHWTVGVLVETVMTYQILATKCLRVESMKVYEALTHGTLEEARYAVSMIVGRDTQVLDEIGVAKAAIETVAENTSDGVVAPMLYTALGGPILGFLYKAVNTMDSMVGYRNDRYQDFGTAAARLDDVVNFIPARISAWLIILASAVLGRDFDAKNAVRIFRRDRFNHKSPNSAQTESACAGALGIQLAGDASYFGKIVHKPTIGDAARAVEYEDIRRVNRLMYGAAVIGEVVCLAVMWLVR